MPFLKEAKMFLMEHKSDKTVYQEIIENMNISG